MKLRTIGRCLLIMLLLFIPNQASAKWAYPFVVWDGYVYVMSDEIVEEVGQQIGKVTKYSDVEGTYSGNFSNVYKKSTKYFSIKGIPTNEAIAVRQQDGVYIKAYRDGEYAGSKSRNPVFIISCISIIIALAILIVFINKKNKQE